MSPAEWRAQVGQHVERRREALWPSRRRAADGSEVSEVVWRQIESGKRQLAKGVTRPPVPEERTKMLICRRLRWTVDSIDELLAGRSPREAEIEVDYEAPARRVRITYPDGASVAVSSDDRKRLEQLLTPDEIGTLFAMLDDDPVPAYPSELVRRVEALEARVDEVLTIVQELRDSDRGAGEGA